jgi:hypothetical protein
MAKRLQYGEETVVMRIPKSMVPKVKAMLESSKVLESIALESSKAPEVERKIMQMFQEVVFLQMAELLATAESDLIEKGLVDNARLVGAMKLEFEGNSKQNTMVTINKQ